jgi:hypothetical protein
MKTWKLLSLAAVLMTGGCEFAEPIRHNNGGGTGVEGILVEPGGSPVGGAKVRVYAVTPVPGLAKQADALALDSMQTNSAGAFRFPDLPDGTYNLAASAHRGDTTLSLYLPGIVVVGKTNLGTDTLQIAGSLAVQVRAAGVAVPGALCAVAGGAWTATTDSTGTCVIPGVPPGSYQVTVSHDSYQITTTGSMIVYPDFLTAGGLVTLTGGGTPAGTAAKLVAYWDFNEGSGTTLTDRTGKSHTGTIVNGTWATGIQGGALSFNGSSSKVTFAHKADLNLSDFTLAAWIKTSFSADGQVILSRQTSSGLSLPWNYRLTLSGSISWDGVFPGHPYADHLTIPVPPPRAHGYAPTFVADGTWHHLVVVNRGTDLEIFVDGRRDTVVSTLVVPDTTSTEPLLIGSSAAHPDNAFFNGLIDEVRIYDGALSATRVDSLYRAFAPGAAMPRIAVVAHADVTISSAIPSLPDVNQYGNKNRGKETGIGPGTTDVNSTSRGLIRFAIPQGYTAAKITSAVIRLTNPQWITSNVSGPFRVDMHRMLKSWKEGNGTLTANSAAIDGATALERFWGNQDGSEDWTERFAGLNDIDAAALPAASVTKSPGDLSSWDFDVTALVKAWAADTTTNFGVILAADFPTSNPTVRSYPIFNTREAPVADSLKPLLIINGGP